MGILFPGPACETHFLFLGVFWLFYHFFSVKLLLLERREITELLTFSLYEEMWLFILK